MNTNQLKLINVSLTPEEARIVGTALLSRSMHWAERAIDGGSGCKEMSDEYARVYRVVSDQSSLSN